MTALEGLLLSSSLSLSLSSSSSLGSSLGLGLWFGQAPRFAFLLLKDHTSPHNNQQDHLLPILTDDA